jgi:glucose-1-phosphate cytidylyltransferase
MLSNAPRQEVCKMKVVLFCGGLGTRLREHSDTIPKPLVNVGDRPIMLHLMRYYAHYGHNEFILCLGYRGDLIRSYFLNYNESMLNDFTLSEGGKRIELASTDIDNWKITFVDTGLNSNIGTRLQLIRKYLEDEDTFLANYSDGLSDLPLDQHIDAFQESGAIGGFVAVRPQQSFHCVSTDPNGLVTSIESMSGAEIRINGGFFCLKNSIFDYMREGEELVEQPFSRLMAEERLWANRYDGFWAAMDTYKDKVSFEKHYHDGDCPWMVWK